MPTAASATPDAQQLLRLAHSLELVLVRTYSALLPLLTSPAAVEPAKVFARHHADHAGGLAAQGAAAGGPNGALSARMGRTIAAARTERDAIEALLELEKTSCATYEHLLTQLSAGPRAAQVATILPVEAQHTVVLGSLVQVDLHHLVGPFQTGDGALSLEHDPVP